MTISNAKLARLDAVIAAHTAPAVLRPRRTDRITRRRAETIAREAVASSAEAVQRLVASNAIPSLMDEILADDSVPEIDGDVGPVWDHASTAILERNRQDIFQMEERRAAERYADTGPDHDRSAEIAAGVFAPEPVVSAPEPKASQILPGSVRIATLVLDYVVRENGKSVRKQVAAFVEVLWTGDDYVITSRTASVNSWMRNKRFEYCISNLRERSKLISYSWTGKWVASSEAQPK